MNEIGVKLSSNNFIALFDSQESIHYKRIGMGFLGNAEVGLNGMAISCLFIY